MGYMIWQLVCFLLAFLGNSVLAFVTLQPFHHTGKSVTVVGLSLLFLLLESLENLRRRLTRATRMVHRPPPSTSRLLLLPPELRQQIWTMLFEDIVEEVKYVHVRNSAPGLYTYADRLRLYTDINPQHSTMWFTKPEYPTRWFLLGYAYRDLSEWPPAFALSCRQIYNEAYYDLCNSTRFYFLRYIPRCLTSLPFSYLFALLSISLPKPLGPEHKSGLVSGSKPHPVSHPSEGTTDPCQHSACERLLATRRPFVPAPVIVRIPCDFHQCNYQDFGDFHASHKLPDVVSLHRCHIRRSFSI